MLFSHTNYRSYLKDLLAERVTANPSYSLRGMARQIGLDHSTLVQILQAKRNLSVERAHVVASRLGLGDAETEYFELLVRYDSAKALDVKASLEERINAVRPREQIHDLQIDLFKVIADWYHLPILQMTGLADFQLTAEAAADRLGIRAIEAAAAIDRLERLELIEKDAEGNYSLTKSRLLTQSEVPNQALRKFHTQMLGRAMTALEEQHPRERVNGSETFAFDPALLGKARKLADDFFDRMVRLSRQSRKKTEVYHLAVNFFSVTKGRNHE